MKIITNKQSMQCHVAMRDGTSVPLGPFAARTDDGERADQATISDDAAECEHLVDLIAAGHVTIEDAPAATDGAVSRSRVPSTKNVK